MRGPAWADSEDTPQTTREKNNSHHHGILHTVKSWRFKCESARKREPNITEQLRKTEPEAISTCCETVPDIARWSLGCWRLLSNPAKLALTNPVMMNRRRMRSCWFFGAFSQSVSLSPPSTSFRCAVKGSVGRLALHNAHDTHTWSSCNLPWCDSYALSKCVCPYTASTKTDHYLSNQTNGRFDTNWEVETVLDTSSPLSWDFQPSVQACAHPLLRKMHPPKNCSAIWTSFSYLSFHQPKHTISYTSSDASASLSALWQFDIAAGALITEGNKASILQGS